MLALELGTAVHAEWVGGVVGTVGAALTSVEYEVGGEMNQPGTGLSRGPRDVGRAGGVHRRCPLGLRFGRVHGGVRRGIDHQTGSFASDDVMHLRVVRHVELTMVARDDAPSARNSGLKRETELPPGAGHESSPDRRRGHG